VNFFSFFAVMVCIPALCRLLDGGGFDDPYAS